MEVPRIVLGRLHDELVRNISFNVLHDQLISGEAFDDVTLEDMKEEPKNTGRIRSLLTELKKGGLKNYIIFKTGLKNTKQGHIVESLEIAEKQVLQELELEKCKRMASLKNAQNQLEMKTHTRPLDIPRSPVTQPESSIHGSPGTHMQDIHEKLGDED